MQDIPENENTNPINNGFPTENGNIPPVSPEILPNATQNVTDLPQNMGEQNMPEKNVSNFNNTENVENPHNIGQIQNNGNNFQPNYYGYQHSYQQNYQPFPPYYQAKSVDLKVIQELVEKNKVQKTANRIGGGLLIFYGIQIVLSFVLGFYMLYGRVMEIIEDPAFTLELNVIITLIGFLSGAFLIYKTENTKPQNVISFSTPKKGTLPAAIMVGVGFCYAANIVVSLLQSSFQNIFPFVQTEIELPRGGLGFILSVISVAVAPALLEEFLFRGAIMGNLIKYGKPFAIFTSAFLFGLVHGNLVQIPFAFLVGLVLGFLIIETDSIWTGVIIHFINNFISVCVDYLGDYVKEDILNIFYLIAVALFIVIGIVGIYILSVRNKNLFSFEKTEGITTSYKKFGWLCSSATVIILFVIIGLSVLFTQLTAYM